MALSGASIAEPNASRKKEGAPGERRSSHRAPSGSSERRRPKYPEVNAQMTNVEEEVSTVAFAGVISVKM